MIEQGQREKESASGKEITEVKHNGRNCRCHQRRILYSKDFFFRKRRDELNLSFYLLNKTLQQSTIIISILNKHDQQHA